MKRDMTLYKYCDIYMLLSDFDHSDTKELFERASKLHMEKVVAFTVLQTAELFDISNKHAIQISNNILFDDQDFTHLVTSPKERTIYIYSDKNIMNRFFSENRKELLRVYLYDAET